MFRNIYLHIHVYGNNVKKSGQKVGNEQRG